MTTEQLIEMLQDMDPSGQRRVLVFDPETADFAELSGCVTSDTTLELYADEP